MSFGAPMETDSMDELVNDIGKEVKRINEEVEDVRRKNKALETTKANYENALQDVNKDAQNHLAARLAQARRRLERVQRMFGDDAARYMYGDAMFNQANFPAAKR